MPNPEYQYSNGLDRKRIVPVLLERVKWLSQADSSPSKSGRYFDDNSYHALVTEEALRAIQNKPDLTDAGFLTYRQQFTESAINRALGLVFNERKNIEQTMLFDLSDNDKVAYLPQGEWCGYQILIAPDHDKVTQLLHAVTHFTENTDVRFCLFRSGETTPIWEQTVQCEGGRYNTHALTDCYLAYGKEKIHRFFFGFQISALQNGAIPYRFDWECENETRVFWAEACTLLGLPISDRTISLSYPPVGFNLEVSSDYDYTDNVLLAPSLFDEIIGLQVAQMILEQTIFTTRKSPEERSVKDAADKGAVMLDLNGTLPVQDAPHTEWGIKGRIKAEAKAIRAAFHKPKKGVIGWG